MSRWSVLLRKWRYPVTSGIAFALLFLSSCALPVHSVSRPEKIWALKHPFIAKKAYRITEHVRFVTDSLEKAGVLTDGNGGQLDAFRHAYWMAALVQEISDRKAEQLGKAHEKGNYLNWKKGGMEDSARADSLMCDMDLKNNSVGITIGLIFYDKTVNSGTLVERVLRHVVNGNLTVMKKNESGDFIDCNGNVILIKDYTGKWFIPKCEVSSNTPVKRG